MKNQIYSEPVALRRPVTPFGERHRRLRHALAALFTACALWGCADDDDGRAPSVADPADSTSDAPPSDPPPVPLEAPAAETSPLAGTRWRAVGIAEDGRERRALGLATRYEFELSGDRSRFTGFDTCGELAGDVLPGEGRLTFLARDVPAAPCAVESESARAERTAIESVLFGEHVASVDGEALALDAASGESLHFVAVPSTAVATALEPAVPDGANVDFRTLLDGDGAIVGDERQPRIEVLRERRALARVLGELGVDTESEIEVDFSRHAVLHVRMGTRGSLGYRVEPLSAVRRDGYTDVTLRFVRPGAGCVTADALSNPWTLVELGSLAQAVRTDLVEIDEPCDGMAPVTARERRPFGAGQARIEPLDVRTRPFDEGTIDGVTEGERTSGYRRIIGDRDALAAALDPDDPRTPALLDDIDFDAESVADVAFGTAPSSGYDIAVAGASGRGRLVLDVLSTVPGEGCGEDTVLTYPRQLVRLPKAVGDGPIVFAERVEARPPCRPPE